MRLVFEIEGKDATEVHQKADAEAEMFFNSSLYRLTIGDVRPLRTTLAGSVVGYRALCVATEVYRP